MKIETNGKGEIILKEVYSGVILQAEKEQIGICMRDGGFELTYNGTVFEAKEGLLKYRDVTFGAKQSPEWEIVECMSSTAGMDGETIKMLGKDFRIDGKIVWVEEFLLHTGWSIHAVRRLSDGEVFRVGDIVYYVCNGQKTRPFVIGHFSLDNNNMTAMEVDWASGKRSRISGLIKVKPPDQMPPAANGKVPVWLTPEQATKLTRLLAVFNDPMAGATAPQREQARDSAGSLAADQGTREQVERRY